MTPFAPWLKIKISIIICVCRSQIAIATPRGWLKPPSFPAPIKKKELDGGRSVKAMT